MVQSVPVGGAFSNANHLWTQSEERRDGNKNRDIVYKSILKCLVSNIKGTDKHLLLRSRLLVIYHRFMQETIRKMVFYVFKNMNLDEDAINSKTFLSPV